MLQALLRRVDPLVEALLPQSLHCFALSGLLFYFILAFYSILFWLIHHLQLIPSPVVRVPFS